MEAAVGGACQAVLDSWLQGRCRFRGRREAAALLALKYGLADLPWGRQAVERWADSAGNERAGGAAEVPSVPSNRLEGTEGGVAAGEGRGGVGEEGNAERGRETGKEGDAGAWVEEGEGGEEGEEEEEEGEEMDVARRFESLQGPSSKVTYLSYGRVTSCSYSVL